MKHLIRNGVAIDIAHLSKPAAQQPLWCIAHLLPDHAAVATREQIDAPGVGDGFAHIGAIRPHQQIGGAITVDIPGPGDAGAKVFAPPSR